MGGCREPQRHMGSIGGGGESELPLHNVSKVIQMSKIKPADPYYKGRGLYASVGEGNTAKCPR